MNDGRGLSRARDDARATQVRILGVPTVKLDRALQVAGELEDDEIAHAMEPDGGCVDGDGGGQRR